MGQIKSRQDQEVEFVKETALAMGIQGDFIASKLDLYMEYAAEDRLLNLKEFQELYKELTCDVIEDAFLDDYVTMPSLHFSEYTLFFLAAAESSFSLKMCCFQVTFSRDCFLYKIKFLLFSFKF